MADYPLLAPTISALNGTKSDPSDNESAALLAAVDRQTRNWLVDFLSTIVDSSTGKIIATALDSDSVPVGGVRGSTANGGTQREILHGSVSDLDLRDLAVIEAKLADLAVTTAKIANNAVTSGKFATGAVNAAAVGSQAIETAGLKDANVTAAKLATDAVETAKIKDSAVTAVKLGANSVTSEKLPIGANGQVLVNNAGTWTPTTISGALSLTGAGVAALAITGSSVGFVRVSERVAASTAGGASAAASWAQKRGVATSWVIDEQTGGTTVSIGAAGVINVEANGVYLVFVSCPSYSAGAHKGKLTLTPVSGPAVDYVCESACSGPGNASSSTGCFLLTVTGASAGTPVTLTLFHYTELAKLVNGLGLPIGLTEVERYARIEMLRITAA